MVRLSLPIFIIGECNLSASLVHKQRGAILGFLRDREYFRLLFKIALPIALQQFLMSSINMVSVLMVGQLGEVPVAAFGLANQIYFLLNLLLFGITSGSAMFTAQLWGKRDIANIHKVLGLALSMGLAAAFVFLLIAEFFPQWALGIYSKDPAVITMGSEYLRVIGLSFLFYAISFCYAIILRSTGEVRIPLIVTFTSLSVNTLLSYMLIFGKFGLPVLGVQGAAIGVLFSRFLECSILLWISYAKRTPVAAKLRELVSYDLAFTRRVLRLVLPVVANEMLWSTGTTVYSVVYARMSTEAIAAMNIVNSIDQIAFVVFIALGHACAVLVGNRIGAGEKQRAFNYAARFEFLGIVGAIGVGLLVLLSSNSILSLYKVPPAVIDYAHRVLTILGLLLWLRASNMILFIGILRSGGDTHFALVMDGVIIWVVGVPLAFIGAFVFHLPVYWVYLLAMSEELTKGILGMYRFFSRKWIHNLAEKVAV